MAISIKPNVVLVDLTTMLLWRLVIVTDEKGDWRFVFFRQPNLVFLVGSELPGKLCS